MATPALASHVARLSADLPQSQVLAELNTRGISMGVGTLRKLQERMAEELKPFREQAQVVQLLEWLNEATRRTGPRKVTLSVGRDGIMLLVVQQKKYREGVAATVSVIDRSGHRVGTVYLGQMPESGQAQLMCELTSLLNQVLSGFQGPLPRLVYVTDAGHHPMEYYYEVLTQMKHPVDGSLLPWEWVVDYYHACEYITTLSHVIFGKGREAAAWARKMGSSRKLGL